MFGGNMLQVVASWAGQIFSEDGRMQIIAASLSNEKGGVTVTKQILIISTILMKYFEIYEQW